jgi:hypothetical protein
MTQGAQNSQQTHPPTPNNYAGKDVDLKLFTPNQDNIPQDYHIAAGDGGICSISNQPQQLALNLGPYSTQNTSLSNLRLMTGLAKL